MILENVLPMIIIVLGLVSLFRPYLLICLFATMPILNIALSGSAYEGGVKVVQIGSVNIFARDYLVLILAGVIVLFLLKRAWLKKQNNRANIVGPLGVMILVLFFWEVFIGFLSYSKGFYWQSILRRLSNEFLMFISLVVPMIEDIENRKDHFFNYVSVLCVFLLALTFWRYGIGSDIQFTSSGTLRAVTGNSVIIFMLALCYALFQKVYYEEYRLKNCVLIVVCVAGIILAGHRSGLLVLLFAMVMRCIYSVRFDVRRLFVPLWAVSFVLIFLLALPHFKIQPGESLAGDLIVRFNDTFDLENQTTKARLDIWGYSFEMLKESPLIGFGSFPSSTQSDEDGSDSTGVIVGDFEIPPHNMFVNKFIYEGFLGLGIVCLFLYVVMLQLKKIKKADLRYHNFLFVYLCSFVIFSVFNTTFTNITGKTYFFIMVGFLYVEALKLKGWGNGR